MNIKYGLILLLSTMQLQEVPTQVIKPEQFGSFIQERGKPAIFGVRTDYSRKEMSSMDEYFASGGQKGLKNVRTVKSIPKPKVIDIPPTPLPAQQDYSIYHDALKLRGLTLNGEPNDKKYYKYANDALDNVYTGKPIKLKVNFKPGAFECGSDKNSGGCYDWDEDKNLHIRADVDEKTFKFMFLHEYAHSTGIKDEVEADKFAQKYIPIDGWYNKLKK